MTYAVFMRRMTVRIRGTDVLSEIGLEINPGQHTAVLGPTGCGKSTLLRVMSGFLHPTSGSALVSGEKVGQVDAREIRKRCAQVTATLMDGAGAHRVDAIVGGAVDGTTLPWRTHLEDGPLRDQALAALDRVGMADYADRHYGACSSRERQRIRLARALVLDPEVVLFDDPGDGLDLAEREGLLADIDSLIKSTASESITVIIASRYPESVPSRVRDVALLSEGRLLAHGRRDQLLDDQMASRAFGVPLRVVESEGRLAMFRRQD